MAEIDKKAGPAGVLRTWLVVAAGIAAMVLMLLTAAGATLYIYNNYVKPEPKVTATIAPVKKLTYYNLQQPIIANFAKGSEARLIKISISILTEDEAVEQALKQHEPLIRNNLLMLISNQNPAELEHLAGKEKLREDILDEVRDIVKEMADINGVKDVLFTTFVMQ